MHALGEHDAPPIVYISFALSRSCLAFGQPSRARFSATDRMVLPLQSFGVGTVVDIANCGPYRQLAPGVLRFFSTSAIVIIIIIGSTGHS